MYKYNDAVNISDTSVCVCDSERKCLLQDLESPLPNTLVLFKLICYK